MLTEELTTKELEQGESKAATVNTPNTAVTPSSTANVTVQDARRTKRVKTSEGKALEGSKQKLDLW